MNKQFFEKVLPAQGNICVVGIKDKSVKPRFVDDIDSAIEQMVAFDKDDYNTFFALGTFEGYERKAAGCIFMRAFFVDLDCGEGKPYTEWADGLIAIHKFVQTTDLPKPIIVNSGRGIHAYWPFDDEIPAEDWKPYAEKFKAFCLDNDLHIDETVTADLARVLRVPGSRNLKGEPLPVEVIQDAEPTSFEYWTERLGTVELPFDLKKVEKGLDPDTKAIYEKRNDNFEYDFMRIAQMSIEGNGCGQIKYILENAASCPEPIWYAGISVAARCRDGSTAIHLMSEDHPKYSWEETEDAPMQVSLENVGLSNLAKPLEPHNSPLTESLMNPKQIRRNQFGSKRIPKKFLSSPMPSIHFPEELMEESISNQLPEQQKKEWFKTPQK